MFTVEIVEKTLPTPIFVVPAVRNQYARIGNDLNVTVEAVAFSTAHFQLIRHLNETDPNTQKTKSTLKVMTIPRVITLIGPETHRMRNDAFRHRITFMFKDLTKSDFGNYSIMAGNTFGYEISQFILIERSNVSRLKTTPEMPKAKIDGDDKELLILGKTNREGKFFL